MSDIKNNLNTDRGDLIYGLCEARSRYFSKLGLDVKNVQTMTEAWVTLDNYNNYFGVFDSVGDSWMQTNKADTLRKFQEKEGELSDSAEKRGRAYYQHLMGSRFSAAHVIDMGTAETLRRASKERGQTFGQTLLTQPSKDLEEAGSISKAYTVIRRACKFGLGLVVTEQRAAFPSAKIHFLLDGLNLPEVAAKTANSSGVPITYSELRYCYRNWASLKGVVLFYVKGSVVKAPWEENYNLPNIFSDPGAPGTPAPGAWIQSTTVAKVSDWEAYKAKREQKYPGGIPQKGLL